MFRDFVIDAIFPCEVLDGPPFTADELWNIIDTLLNKAANTVPEDDQLDFYMPEADIFETETTLRFVLPLPGVKAEDIKIEATATDVSIEAERKELYTNSDQDNWTQQGWLADSNSVQLFEYSLPSRVNPDQYTAKLTDGVLVIEWQKQPSVTVDVKIQST